MANLKLNLTRDQLSLFLKDHESIKQFERLFAVADAVAPDSDTPGISVQAGNAQSAAEQAIGMVLALTDAVLASCAVIDAKASQSIGQVAQINEDLSTSIATADNKANQALEMLAKLAKDVEGLQSSPPAREFKRARYGQFYDTNIQIAAAINTPQAITFNTTDVTRGVFIGTPSSRVYVDTEGVYNFLYSIQLDKTSGGTGIFWVWPRINGIDVPDSNSQVQIQGNNAEQLVTIGYFFELKAGDYVEIMFAVNDVSVQVEYFPASAFYPAVPSIILTVSNNIQGVQ